MFRFLISVFVLLGLATMAFADMISGSVVGPDNKPVAGAKVIITQWGDPPEFKATSQATTTDATGKFTIDITPREYKAEGKVNKYYGLATVVAPGLAVKQRSLEADPEKNRFALEKAVPLSGKVVDTKGKGVANVELFLAAYYRTFPRQDAADEENRLNPGEGLDEFFRAKTGAEGTFTFAYLPAEGEVFVIQMIHPEYVSTSISGKRSSGKPIVLVARPGAVLTGKVVDEAGKPLAGISVSVSGDISFNMETAADGTYRLTNLATGSYTLTTYDKTKALVANAKTEVAATEGKTAAVPDFVMTKGAEIVGRVTDAETGEPVANWLVTCNGPHFPVNSRIGGIGEATDKDGFYRVRVMPGECRLSSGIINDEYPSGFNEIQKSVTVRAGETATVNFTLTKGLTVEGTVVGEDGKPLKDVRISVLREGYGFQRDRSSSTNAEGKFRHTGIEPQAQSLKVFVEPKWIVLSPESISVNPNTKKLDPIVVKLKPADVRTLTARVLDAQGKPLSGVRVGVTAYRRVDRSRMDNFRNYNEVTKGDGKFQVDTLQPGEIVRISPFLDGYRYLSGGNITEEGGQYRATDIVLTSLRARASGIVVDSKGKPVANVLVWCRETPRARAIYTDAKGGFTLENLPSEGDAHIFAAKGKLRASYSQRRKPQTTKIDLTGLKLTLVPRPNADEPQIKARLVEALRQDVSTNKRWQFSLRSTAEFVARRDPNLALWLVTDRDGKIADIDRYSVLEGFCQGNSKQGHDRRVQLAWCLTQFDKFTKPEYQCRTRCEWLLTLAETNPTAAQENYAEIVQFVRQNGSENSYNWGRLAAVSMLLRKGDEDAFLAEGDKHKATPWSRRGFAAVLARADGWKAEAALAEVPDNEKLWELRKVIEVLASRNPLVAQTLLKKMRAMVKKGDFGEEVTYLTATKFVIKGLGPVDPEAALALTKDLPEPEGGPMYPPFVYSMAARYQKGEKAVAAWQTAIKSARKQEWSAPPLLIRLAAECAGYNGPPQIVQECWQEAKQNLEKNPEFSFNEETTAYMVAFLDPAYAQRMADSVYGWLTDKPEQTWNSRQFSELALSRVPFDLNETVQLIESLPEDQDPTEDKGWPRFSARCRLLQLLSLTPAERRLVPSSAWYNDDWKDLL